MSMSVRVPHLLVAWCALIAGCTAYSDLEGLTYNAYARTEHAAIIDLVGASDISVYYASEIDTADTWFSFQISRDDFVSLVESFAESRQGPDQIEWTNTASIPESWQARHSAPSWWKIPPAKDYKSVSWCYAARPSYYHGWYFYHDGRKDRAFCWHWNYQHGDLMCDE